MKTLLWIIGIIGAIWLLLVAFYDGGARQAWTDFMSMFTKDKESGKMEGPSRRETVNGDGIAYGPTAVIGPAPN